jgi:LPS-assembly protein
MPMSDLPRLFQRKTETGPPLPTGEATRFSADRLSSQQEAISTFTGNVVVTQEKRRVEGERADYDKRTDLLDITGKVRYYTPDLFLQGERARFNLGNESGWLTAGQFRVREAHAYGEAAKITVTDPEHTHLDEATYTTCNPDHIDWQLKANRIDLDEATNTGEAYNTTVSFKGVPFFYTPYINFPLKGRKSGFLAPSYGDSTINGTEISVPYYWNIAPNRDATTTPRYIENRGTMLLGEFRYLNPESAGQINLD